MANTWCLLLILTLLYLLFHRSWAGRGLGSAAYLTEEELLNSKPEDQPDLSSSLRQLNLNPLGQESDLEKLREEYLVANVLLDFIEGEIKKDHSNRHLDTLKELIKLLESQRSKISGHEEHEKLELGIKKAEMIKTQQEKADTTLLELKNLIAGYFEDVGQDKRPLGDPELDDIRGITGVTVTPLQTPRINEQSLDKLLEELDRKLYDVRNFQTGMKRRLGKWVKRASDLHSVTQGLLEKIGALHKKTSFLVGEVKKEHGRLINERTEKQEGTSSKAEEEGEKELTEEEKLEEHVKAFKDALSNVKKKGEEYRKQFKEYRKEEEVLFEEKREG